MIQLQSYVSDSWQSGEGVPRDLVNPSTNETIAQTSTQGLDFKAAMTYARDVGGPALRALSYEERGSLLKQMSRAIYAERERLLIVSRDCNGATRGDSKFDVDGATGTLAWYASLGKRLGDKRVELDGLADKLAANARYVGQHVRLPRPGVAVHINAFNFPAWGAFEKIACAILAGMPVVSKPATSTCLLTYEMMKIVIDAGFMPKGTLSFVAGSAGDLLSHLGPQDVVAFTGSADTAATLRQTPAVLHQSTRFTAEADSLNAAVLGPDVMPGDDIWHSYIRNIVKDMTQKAGQKCTAIRRIIVPSERVDDVAESLIQELSRISIGYPLDKSIDMGPVASKAQYNDVQNGIEIFSKHAEVLHGGIERINGLNVDEGVGYFVAPTLFKARDSHDELFHSKEIFGPCATILSYSGDASEAAALVAKGQGCLVSSVYSNDKDWLGVMLFEAAPWNGRLQMVSQKIADSALPPGMVLPNQIHGGPGRAGGGEELGGLRGIEHYSNRIAIQGDRGILSKLLGEKLVSE